MASLDQVLNMGAGQPATAGAPVPTARPGTPTGGQQPMYGQALAGMQPGQAPFQPGMQSQNPLETAAQEMDGPELAHLFGVPPNAMPPLDLMDLVRLLQMRAGWEDALPDYGAILD